MIEKEGVLVHLDPKDDRIGDADFEFTGWIVADRSISAVWLPTVGSMRLTTSERPDVRRVFPDRIAIGFSGKCRADALGAGVLKIAVQLPEQILEVEHPVQEPLPKAPLRQRMVSSLQLAWLQLRERMASNSSNRFVHTLQRHLLARRLRGGVFRRRHTEKLLEDFATSVPDAVFVQIGANDGFTGDPLNHLIERADTRWQGILVEPVAHLFAQLSQRYGQNPGLGLERAAIGESDGITVIHRLEKNPADSLWLEQIPSLDPKLLRRSADQFGKGESAIVEEEVPSLTVATLLKRHDIKQLDLLVIDAEGSDWRILRQFNLKLLRPRLILYEHQHLSAEEREEAHHFLDRFNYGWAETEEGDTVAWALAPVLNSRGK
jgi:FkbM family methyltransferase